MLPNPTKYNLVAGSTEGSTILNAFDGALLNAGAGNLNLVRVSSLHPELHMMKILLFLWAI